MKKSEQEIIDLNLVSAMRGKKVFKKYAKKIMKELKLPFLYDEILFIFFPSKDKEINYYGMAYLDEYILRNYTISTYVFYIDSFVENNISYLVERDIHKIRLNEQEMQELLMYYRLMEFHRNVKVISLDEPIGRNGSALIGSGKITKEMLVAVGIYRIIPFESNLNQRKLLKG